MRFIAEGLGAPSFKGLPLGLLLALPLLFGGTAFAADDMLPPKVQAVLLSKIFAYDRALKGVKARIHIAHGPASASLATDLTKLFEELGMKVTAGMSLPTGDASAQVVYVAADAKLAEVKAYCERVKALSVAGRSDVVTSGEVAVAVAKNAQGKPGILVHLPRLKTEGHEISSDLLRLAQVIK